MRSPLALTFVATLLSGCSQPAPAPTPSPSAVVPCHVPEPGPAGDYVGIETRDPEHLAVVLLVREKIGRHQCWLGNESVPLALMATELRAIGRCASANEDRVIIERSDGAYEEWHVIRYLDGCWATAERAYRGTLVWVAAQ